MPEHGGIIEPGTFAVVDAGPGPEIVYDGTCTQTMDASPFPATNDALKVFIRKEMRKALVEILDEAFPPRYGARQEEETAH